VREDVQAGPEQVAALERVEQRHLLAHRALRC
jgi:hypothetical protein